MYYDYYMNPVGFKDSHVAVRVATALDDYGRCREGLSGGGGGGGGGRRVEWCLNGGEVQKNEGVIIFVLDVWLAGFRRSMDPPICRAIRRMVYCFYGPVQSSQSQEKDDNM